MFYSYWRSLCHMVPPTCSSFLFSQYILRYLATFFCFAVDVPTMIQQQLVSCRSAIELWHQPFCACMWLSLIEGWSFFHKLLLPVTSSLWSPIISSGNSVLVTTARGFGLQLQEVLKYIFFSFLFHSLLRSQQDLLYFLIWFPLY